MESSVLEDEIRQYLSRTLLVQFGADVTRESDLFASGQIDSYGLIELITFLEQTYGIGLSSDDLASPDLATLSGMTRMVAERRTTK
jgi:D-alanine--poly(phosphoribitol) ligase subunit 2